jgi:hypothetical protein
LVGNVKRPAERKKKGIKVMKREKEETRREPELAETTKKERQGKTGMQ